MGQNRIQTGHKSQTRQIGVKKDRTQDRLKSSARTRDMVILRQAVYELPPLELYEYLSHHEEENPIDENEEELNAEDLLDLDSELDLSDEDEDPQEYENPLYDYTGYSVNAVDFAQSAVLSLSNAYCITVLKHPLKGFACSFEGPDWFYGKNRGGAYEYVLKLRKLIEEIAFWFEETHQIFLSDPSPGSFSIGAKESLTTPCVLQNGFAEIMNQRLSGYEIDKTIISRVKDNIWLLWDKFSMPLKSVFSEEFRMAWVVEKCVPAYKNNEVFLEQGLRYDSFSRNDLKTAKTKNFEALDPEQRLRVLCSNVNLDKQKIETVFEEICLKVGNS